jgi:hypothetical protein
MEHPITHDPRPGTLAAAQRRYECMATAVAMTAFYVVPLTGGAMWGALEIPEMFRDNADTSGDWTNAHTTGFGIAATTLIVTFLKTAERATDFAENVIDKIEKKTGIAALLAKTEHGIARRISSGLEELMALPFEFATDNNEPVLQINRDWITDDEELSVKKALKRQGVGTQNSSWGLSYDGGFSSKGMLQIKDDDMDRYMVLQEKYLRKAERRNLIAAGTSAEMPAIYDDHGKRLPNAVRVDIDAAKSEKGSTLSALTNSVARINQAANIIRKKDGESIIRDKFMWDLGTSEIFPDSRRVAKIGDPKLTGVLMQMIHGKKQPS